jgi:hypothetical protein
MTTAFIDAPQIEDFQGLEEYLEDNMESIMEDWDYVEYPENEDGTYGWDDDQAPEQFSLECAFGPDEY